MRIAYVLLSPTFGMHQYTADLAYHQAVRGVDVHLVTTRTYPADRYGPQVTIHTPVATRSTGFAPDGLAAGQLRDVQRTLVALQPDVVHVTGVHLWNVFLVRWLSRRRIPCIHTVHDLDPHAGVRFSRLIRLWNRLILRSASHILVHGRVYRDRLLAMGLPEQRVTFTPLLHLFLSQSAFAELNLDALEYQSWGLFFGRLERYKGITDLLTAATMLSKDEQTKCLVLAGPGSPDGVDLGTLSPRVEVRNRLIQDAEAVDLFQRCGVLVLPYRDATQSALVAAACFFAKPVIVTRTGALPEYVQAGETGWIVPPGDPTALAACLDTALADPARLQRMGSTGRGWYDDQRRQEASTLAAMYESVVAAVR